MFIVTEYAALSPVVCSQFILVYVVYLDGNPVLMVNCSSMIRLFQINDMYFKTGMPTVFCFSCATKQIFFLFLL